MEAKTKVLLGMSGGTDSSVSAMLLQEQGYEVVGATLWLFDDFSEPGKMPPFITEAQMLAQKLGIEHHVVEAKRPFREKVLDYFINEYLAGRTPFPCIVCNRTIKWKLLDEIAQKLGCEKIATGHYARIVDHNGHIYFSKAIDDEKDQSFFLWNIETDLLPKIVLPLGKLTKTAVRQMAADRGFLSVSQKKDSLGVCFIEGPDYRDFLKNELNNKGISVGEGFLTDGDNHVIGTHQGFPYYTIGQRRGLNHGQNQALFVTHIDAAKNIVQLGNYEKLKRERITVTSANFYYLEDIDPTREYILKVRYRKQATPCSINNYTQNGFDIQLHEPLFSVANGQSAVLYSGNRVIGGGVIERAE